MLNRRSTLKAAAATMAALPFGSALSASESAPKLGKAEHMIMIWLGGGMAQMDTFDPKRVSKDGLKDPGSAYPSIPTAIPGVKVCKHLKQTADILDTGLIFRTLHHNEIDEHAAASYRMHIGRPTSGTVQYPCLGSCITALKDKLSDTVPPYVLMGHPSPGRSPGFLGPENGFTYLTDTQKGPAGLVRPERVTQTQHDRRRRLLEKHLNQFAKQNTGDSLIESYQTAVKNGYRLAGPEFLSVFDLESEKSSLRESYGDEFGQRCLLARRLVERGSRFVEVSFNVNFVNGTGWDTHREGQEKQHLLIQQLDQAIFSLVTDLRSRNLLEKTLVVISTEFGRPPEFDSGGGRGHQSTAFTNVVFGGGLNTGQAIGETDELARKHVAGPQVSIPDYFATLYAAMGIDPHEELYAGARPVPMTDGGKVVESVFS